MKKNIMATVATILLTGIIFVLHPPTASAKTYKIGAVFSVTGPASFLGDPEKKTAEMLVAEINRGGGINGTKVELIVEDTGADATKARLAVQKLMTRDKVLAVIGPSTSGNSIGVLPLAEKYKTPLISVAASYKIVTKDLKTGEQYHWVFKTPQSDTLAAEAIYTHMNHKGFKRVAVVSVNTGFGASGREELLRLAPSFGIQIVADEKYGPKDTDMTAQLTKIKGLGADAIVNWSIGPTQVTIVRNWKDLAMTKVAFYQSHGFGSKKNIELAAGAAEGIYLPLASVAVARLLPADHPQKAVTMGYVTAYEAKFNEPVSTFGGHAWDAVTLVTNAIRAVGGNREKIRSYLEKTRGFVGQHGVFNFSSKDHNGLTKEAFNMLVVKNNDWAFAD